MTGLDSTELNKFYQQYPKIVVIITAQANGKRNAMTVARHTSVTTNPPTYGISVQSRAFTYQLIAESGEFGVNFLPFEAVELVDAVGSTKGREIDKFQKFNIGVEKAEKTAVPILKAAYAAYECKVISDTAYGSNQWVLGEVVAMHVLKECLAPQKILDINKVSPVLSLGEQHYLTVDKETLRYVSR